MENRKYLNGVCRLIILVGLSILLLGFHRITVQAGWVKTPEYRYLDEDGTWKQDEWVQGKEGDWYYLDENGVMVTGFYDAKDGNSYFFNHNGRRESGLVKVNGRVFFYNENGAMLIGEILVNGNRHNFTETGAEPDGIFVVKEKCFILEDDGSLYLESDEAAPERKEAVNLPALLMIILGVALFSFYRKADRNKKAGGGREIFLIFIAVLFASVPLYLPYLIKGHDLPFHLNRILGLRASLENGMFPVRLNSFTFNGYGYGEPVFYPSLFLYIPAVLNLIGIPLVDSVNLWLLLVNIATAAVMYYSASRLFASRQIGCVSSILYTLGVYRLGNIYTRAAYGELTAMIFFPLIIYGIYQLFYGDKGKWWILTVGLTGVVQSHIISTLFVSVGCVVAAMICIRRILERGRFAACIKMGICTILINLWFLMPLLDYMRAGINLDTLQYRAQDFTLTVSKLLEIYPISMGATPVSYEGARGTMALCLGLPVIAGIILYICNMMDGKGHYGEMEGKREEKQDGSCPADEGMKPGKKATAFLLIGLAVTLFATNLFPWERLMELKWFGMIGSFIQFPWRFLNMSLCFLSLACAYAVCHRWGVKFSGYVQLAVLLLCILSSQHLLEGYYQSVDYCWNEKDISSMIDQKEYLYAGTKKNLAEGSVLPAGEGLTITDSEKDGLMVTFSYQALSEGTPAFVDLPLFYYPGYQAMNQDGYRLPVVKSDDGLARVLLSAAKEGSITVKYRERRLWRLCEMISVVTVLIIIIHYIRLRRKKSNERNKNSVSYGRKTGR